MLALMNMVAPIWALVFPEAAIRATVISWDVRRGRPREGWVERAQNLAERLELAAGAPGESRGSAVLEDRQRHVEVLGRLAAPALAAQPFTVEQVGTGELDVDPDVRRAPPGQPGSAARSHRPALVNAQPPRVSTLESLTSARPSRSSTSGTAYVRAPAPNGCLDEVLVLQRGDVQEGVIHERLQAEVRDLVGAVGDLA